MGVCMCAGLCELGKEEMEPNPNPNGGKTWT